MTLQWKQKLKLQTDRHTYRQTYIQTDRHTDRQTDIQTDRQTVISEKHRLFFVRP